MGNSPIRTLSATEVKNRFGAVLREVTRTGGPILVERDGRPVAVILSVRAYEETCRAPLLPAADRIALARAAFGMWAGREDIDDEWLEHGRRRWRSEWPDA
ncbi:MAG: type II toxin-antitoxin system Phd/YefM family antitoxin [Anaerolineae bacterium]